MDKSSEVQPSGTIDVNGGTDYIVLKKRSSTGLVTKPRMQNTLAMIVVQAAAATSSNNTDESGGATGIIIMAFMWILEVFNTVLGTVLLGIAAYRLLKWSLPATAAAGQLRDDGAGAQVGVQGEVVPDFSLDWLTVDALKVLCRKQGLPTSGVKSDLQHRVQIASRWTLTKTTRI